MSQISQISIPQIRIFDNRISQIRGTLSKTINDLITLIRGSEN